MAVITKKVAQVSKVAPKVAPKVATQRDGFQVVDVDNIEFLSTGRGGGKPMDPATAALVNKALSLSIGQAIKVPQELRIKRGINGANGQSVLHTYKGAQSLSKRSKAQGMRFRTRRDTAGNLWLFRVEPLEVAEQVQE